MSSQPEYQVNQRPPIQRSNIGGSKIQSAAKHSTPEQVRGPPALIAVIGWWGYGKTTFVNSASGSCLSVGSGNLPETRRIQASNEFELDGQRVVLIDTPGIIMSNGDFNGTVASKQMTKSIKDFLAESYPTGTKLAGVVFVQQPSLDNRYEASTLCQSIGELKELCGDTTLKTLVIMTYRRDKVKLKVERKLNSDLSPGGCFHPAIEQGAQVYHYSDAYNSDLGALRTILRGRPVAPKVQQGHSSDIKRLEENVQKAMDKKVEELRRELEESIRKESRQELEKEKRRAREEADGFRKRIAEMQSKLEEVRHTFACLPLDQSSSQFANRLDDVLHGQDYERCVQNFQKDDLVWFVDYLDKALDSLDPLGPASRKCLRELGSICATHAILPTSCSIPSHLLTVDPHPFASGAFGEVYRATLGNSLVCVKRLRAAPQDDLAFAIKMFCKEAAMWKTLNHPNILPLLGASISPPQLVSALMPAGDLSKYIPRNPDTNRIGLLSEIAEGLCYLHSRNLIHGDLKGMNILVEVIDNVPHARIADFGISIVTKNLDSIRADTRQDVHTPRWSAPEIFRDQNPSQKSDIYSFAMVTIEVFTGEIPFSSEKVNWMIALAVLRGDRPSRPEHASCTDDLWALIQRCWDKDPDSRPEILEVSQTFSSISTN